MNRDFNHKSWVDRSVPRRRGDKSAVFQNKALPCVIAAVARGAARHVRGCAQGALAVAASHVPLRHVEPGRCASVSV